MIGIILRRILIAIPVLIIVASITFFLTRLAPGGPFDAEKKLPQEVIDKVKAFRESDAKLTVMSMQKEVSQMDGQNLVDDQTPTSPALKFMYWHCLLYTSPSPRD